MNRILRYFIRLFLLIIILIGLLPFLLISTTTGSNWLLQGLTIFSPVSIKFQQVQGNFLESLIIKDVVILLSEEQQLEISNLEVKINYKEANFMVDLKAPHVTAVGLLNSNLILRDVNFNLQGWPQAYALNGTWNLSYPDYPGLVNAKLTSHESYTETLRGELILTGKGKWAKKQWAALAEIKWEDELVAHVNINIDKNNYIRSDWRLPEFKQWATKPIHSQKIIGDIKLKLTQLNLLQTISTQINANRGQITADLSVAGTIEKPKIQGNITFNHGEIVILPLNINLNKIQIVIDKADYNLLAYHATLSNQQGVLKVTGTSHLALDPPRAEFHITGKNFLIYNYPNMQIYATPDLNLKLSFPTIELSGNLLIPTATVSTIEFNDYMAPSPDIVIVRSKLVQPIATPWQFKANIALQLGNAVSFSGYGLQTKIAGKLDLHQQENVTTANGELQLVNGKYTAYGQTLDISRGRLIYTGGTINNPTLYITAERKIRALKRGAATTQELIDTSHTSQSVVDGIVGVRVQGSLAAPKISLFSNPDMPTTDQLAYLIADVPSNQLSSAQSQLLSEAVFSLLKVNPASATTNKISTLFGLDEVNIKSDTDIDPNTGKALSRTSLVLGKALSPKLFVSFSVGLLDPINVLKLQYKLSQHWLAQTSSSTDGNSAGDILYYWDKD